jgi:ATP-dependent RNA helicase DHX57
MVVMDGWIQFRAVAKTAVIVKYIRKLINTVLANKITNPSLDISADPVVQAVIKLVTIKRE